MKYNIGDTAEFSKTIGEADVYLFAGITGDLNPMHVNEEYAKTTRFGKRVVHGMLTSSFICTVLGTKLPGEGTIHVSQQLNFRKPVFLGNTITAKLKVSEILDKGLMRIETFVYNQNDEIVVDGYAIVKLPEKK